MDNKSKLLALMIAGTLSLSGCGAQAIEPVSTAELPINSEPAVSSQSAETPSKDKTSDTSSVSKGEEYQVKVEDELDSKPIISEYTLSTLTENHLAIFKVAIAGYPEQINSGIITIEEGDTQQNGYIEVMVMEGELPENGNSLFVEWKESVGYYDQFEDIEQPVETDPVEEESQQPSSGTQQSGGSTQQSSKPSSSNTNPTGGNSSKPQPSTNQQQQQQQQQPPSNDGDFKTTTEENNDMLESAGGDGEGSGLDWSLWD